MSRSAEWLSRLRRELTGRGRLGAGELGLLGRVLAVVGAVWAFAELTDAVLEGGTRAFDRAVLLALRQSGDLARPVGPAWVVDAARSLTALGDWTVLLLLTVVVVGFLLLQGRRRMAGFVVAAMLGGEALATVLKELVARPRPDVVPHLVSVQTSSFPSGHSMMAAVAYLTLAALAARVVAERRLKVYLLVVAMGVTLLVGVTRVYLGVHYPTDVLAGWTAGLAWALLCGVAARALQRRGRIRR